jgi:hypothetical protein
VELQHLLTSAQHSTAQHSTARMVTHECMASMGGSRSGWGLQVPQHTAHIRWLHMRNTLVH